jgi:TusA-related sulfurtransferase
LPKGIKERIIVTKLNLSEIVWPICLLKCDAALRQLSAGCELELMVNDVDLIDALCRIINAQPDLIYEINQAENHYHIRVHRFQRAAEMKVIDQKKRRQP